MDSPSPPHSIPLPPSPDALAAPLTLSSLTTLSNTINPSSVSGSAPNPATNDAVELAISPAVPFPFTHDTNRHYESIRRSLDQNRDLQLYQTGSLLARTLGRFLFGASILAITAAIVFGNLLLYSENVRLAVFNSTSLPGNPNPQTPGRNPTNNRLLLKLDATTKGAYFGVSIDWEAKDTPASFNKRFGRQAAVFQHFMDISQQLERVDELKYIVDSVLQVDGALLAITIIPHNGLNALTPQSIDQLARTMKAVNDQGIPVLLRYAHEMNGSWYAYGQKPSAYIESFRTVSSAVRKYTTQTYMVWAPNVPSGYPWTTATTPRSGSADFIAMDTNRDNVINELDDPYTPYYPGDDFVDWIGFSIFHFGPPGSLTTNALPSTTAVSQAIQYKASSSITWDIYKMFSELHNKPFGLMETSAAFHPNAVKPGDPTELDIKRVWWRQVFNDQFHSKFPLLKLICWFDIRKTELVSNVNDLRDFRVTWVPDIMNQFLSDLPTDLVFFADTPNT